MRVMNQREKQLILFVAVVIAVAVVVAVAVAVAVAAVAVVAAAVEKRFVLIFDALVPLFVVVVCCVAAVVVVCRAWMTCAFCRHHRCVRQSCTFCSTELTCRLCIWKSGVVHCIGSNLGVAFVVVAVRTVAARIAVVADEVCVVAVVETAHV